jgi:hypothetical protein
MNAELRSHRPPTPARTRQWPSGRCRRTDNQPAIPRTATRGACSPPHPDPRSPYQLVIHLTSWYARRMGSPKNAQVVLDGSTTSLVTWLENEAAIPMEAAEGFLARPTYSSARILVNSVDKVVHVYMAALSLVQSSLAQRLGPVLHTELPSVWSAGWIRTSETVGADVAVGLAARLRDLVADLQASGQVTPSIVIHQLRPQPAAVMMRVDQESMTYLAVAGLDQLMSEQRGTLYSSKLAHLQTTLGIRPAELARLLQVSREAVRQWFDGAPISPDRWSDIDRLDRLVQGLLSYFKIEALPAIVRRKIPGLEQRTPLEMIRMGREQELLNFYAAVFTHGVTQ